MSTDISIRSRRAVLGAALGGAAVVAAQSLARPLPAAAATDDPALIGNANTGDATTSFENTDAGEPSLAAVHAGSGAAIEATSATGPGIRAVSTDNTPSDGTIDPSHRNGVYGAVGDTTNASTVTDEAGVYGFCDVSTVSAGVVGESLQGFGVLGVGDTGVAASGAFQGLLAVGSWGAYATGEVGLVGDVTSTGVGVYGFTGNVDIPNPPTGIGVYARAASTSQLALRVQGKAKFSRSGRVAIKGQTKTVRLSGVSASNTFVVATCQEDMGGVYVRSVVPANGSFKVHLSKKPPKAVTVGWIAFEKP
jgi:hypothetical protein